MAENKPDTEAGIKQGSVNFGKVDYTKAQGIRFYANHVAANSTLFDIRLVLSDVDVAGDGVSAVQTVTVMMSPELAILVHSILGKTLDKYANTYGKDRLPESALTSLKTDPLTEVDPPR